MAVERRPILVVDDDPKIVRLVRLYLERERFAVIEAADGRRALAQIAEHDPQLVILDMMLPELDGLSVLRTVRLTSATPVIVLSARGTTADRITGLREGADDYVPKPFSPAELVQRVKRVLARAAPERPADAGPLELGDLAIDRSRHLATLAGRPVELTAIEFRLLVALLEAKGRVLGRDQLLDAIYGLGGASALDRTIDVHVGRLRRKLGDRATRPSYVATVRGAGYRSPVERQPGGRAS
ncbi:MAG TPA: response regulator transcription factor [Candidatus Limnocylindrales bacterium]|nr:response regulator transcription factor [Candidatus Limnocylindrales bacterium]